MEIPGKILGANDGGLELAFVEVPEGDSWFVDVRSVLDVPLPKRVRLMPHNVRSGQTLNCSFPSGSDQEVNEMFETKDKLWAKLQEAAVYCNF